MGPHRDRVVDYLAKSKVFRGLPREVLRDLADSAAQRTYGSKQLLYETGARADELLVVLEGQLEISRQRGERLTYFRSVGPGSVVGWSTLAGESHTADLLAGSKLTAALVPGSAVRRLIRQRPELAIKMIAELGQLVGKLSDEIEELQWDSLDQRLWRAICDGCDPGQRIAMTQERFARILGASRRHVAMALKRLTNKGLVCRGRGWIERLR